MRREDGKGSPETDEVFADKEMSDEDFGALLDRLGEHLDAGDVSDDGETAQEAGTDED